MADEILTVAEIAVLPKIASFGRDSTTTPRDSQSPLLSVVLKGQRHPAQSRRITTQQAECRPWLLSPKQLTYLRPVEE